MTTQAPSIDHLRAVAELRGIDPSDEDLAAVQEFLSFLLPAFEELRRLTPDGTVPAGMFIPTESP